MKKVLWASLVILGASMLSAAAAPMKYATNGHYYEYIPGSLTWPEANAAAMGMTHMGLTGYLATVTSAGEWGFLDTMVNPSKATAWLGG
ncbi:MAG: hypothetical protein AAGF94_18390, partial [Pseudomonadota bacterium]